jgi:signal transduction histidine kinase/streptogramin lyase
MGYCSPFEIFAQTKSPVFRNITSEDGLPTTSVTDIDQDTFGFIWIGTWDGVYRFDGKKYEKIFQDGRYIESDQEGGLWISIQTGHLGYYHPSYDSVIFFENVDESIRYLDLKILENKNVLAGTGSGIKRFDPASQTFILEEGQKKGAVRELNEGNDGRMNFLSFQEEKIQLGSRSPEGKYSYEDFPIDKNNEEQLSFYQTSPTIVFPYGDKGAVIFNPNGFAKRESPNEDWKFFQVSSPEILKEKGFENYNSYKLQGNYLWLNQINAISRVDLETGEMETINSEINNSRGLLPMESNHGCNLYIDRQGILWASRFSYGLSLLNLYQSDFGLLRDENGIVIADILSAAEMEDGTFWVGTRTSLEKGLIHFSEDGKTILERIGAQEPPPSGGKTIGKALSHYFPWKIFVSSDGTLWVGTGQPGPGYGGLNRISPNFNQIIRYKHDPLDPNSLSQDWIFNISEDPQGKLWITHSEGIDFFDPESEKFSKIDPEGKFLDLDAYLVDPNGHLLGVLEEATISGESGQWLFTLNTQTKEIKKLNLKGKRGQNYFTAQPIIDKQNRVWVAMREGFGYTDLTYEKFLHWVNLEETAFPDLEINAISYNDRGELYFATSDGIIQYSPDSGNFRRFGFEMGLQSLLFGGLNYRGESGKIFFSGNSGANVFHPDQIKTNSYPPEILFKEILLDGESYQRFLDSAERQPSYMLSSLVVPPGITTLVVQFAAIHFGGNGQNQSQYRLVGFNEDWQDAGTNGSLTYTNLPVGKYVLEVRSMNLDGVWNLEPETLKITVLPPWYLTWWAYSIYAVVIILLAMFFIRGQRRRAAKKERDKAIDRELAQAKEIEKAYENLKAAQEQLVQQEKLASLGQLTAGIAHEIKNPLNFVNNFSEVSMELIEEALEEIHQIQENEHAVETVEILSDIKSNLIKIYEHGTRANRIVSSMLQHSRGGEGKMEPTDLNALIKEYVNLSFHGMRAGKNPINVDIEMNLDAEVRKVNLVSEDFSRVIVNLCNNAFDAMRSKMNSELYQPKLLVRTKAEGNQVIIEVEDNGPGIPDEIKDKILQPFFTTKKGTEGTGLGLSITHDIIKAHGGQLDIKSEIGIGSEFKISLPTKIV